MASPFQNDQSAVTNQQTVETYVRRLEQLKSNHSIFIQQSELILQTIEDNELTKKTLEEVSKKEVGEEVLIPIGLRVLMKFHLANISTVTFRIGANILHDMNIQDSIKKLEEKNSELKKTAATLRDEIFKTENQIISLENYLNQLSYSQQE